MHSIIIGAYTLVLCATFASGLHCNTEKSRKEFFSCQDFYIMHASKLSKLPGQSVLLLVIQIYCSSSLKFLYALSYPLLSLGPRESACLPLCLNYCKTTNFGVFSN